MTSTKNTAAETVRHAIRTSKRENRCVDLEYSDALETELLAASDDSAEENDGSTTYWGVSDDSGDQWSVRLYREESEPEETEPTTYTYTVYDAEPRRK